MHEDLARLEQLDTLDRDIAAHHTAIAKLAERLKDARAGAVTAKETHEGATTAVDDNDKAQKANTRRTREYEQRRDSAVRILEMGTGDPDAAERQRTSCLALIDDAETEMLELMEQADAHADALEAATTALAEAEAALTLAEREVPEQTTTLQAEIEDLTGRRTPLLDELPADIRSRYQAWRDRGKWAVARIERNACKACRMEIRPQHLTDLRKGRMEPCRGCHRWLIPDTVLA
ncbi:MAG: hypothetical protein AAF211_18185 [Myxococcota bacterium]